MRRLPHPFVSDPVFTVKVRDYESGQVEKAGLGSVNDHYVKSASYHPHGAMSEMEFGNGVKETYGFNSRLQPTSIGAEVASSQVTLLSLVNTYGATNNNGNVLTQTITVRRRKAEC